MLVKDVGIITITYIYIFVTPAAIPRIYNNTICVSTFMNYANRKGHITTNFEKEISFVN